jgi:hypothetical protein
MPVALSGGFHIRSPAALRESALVLCVDEKSQIQALDRTAPMLPRNCGVMLTESPIAVSDQLARADLPRAHA